MAIKDWPAGEQPREKLLGRGAGALSDAELLAIFLRTGMRGISAVDLARNLLLRFGGLRALLEADQTTFCEGPGLGQAKFCQLQAVLELARRHMEARLKREAAIGGVADTRDYLQARLRDRANEVFAVVFLDTRHRIIAFEEMFQGTIDGAAVYARPVVQRALAHRAAAVILAHNHPSGVAEPSTSDRRMTERLRDALTLVDVRVLDHMVIGDGETVSFAERGWL